MEDSEQRGESLQRKTQAELETLSLRDLFPYWRNLLWQASVFPMLQHLLQINLTMSESHVLRQLQHNALTISEVGHSLSMTPSAASRAVDRLVHDGFVNRSENPADRRQKQLALTASGAALVENLNNAFTSQLEHLVARLSSEEQEQFRRLIAHMIATYPDEALIAEVDETSV